MTQTANNYATVLLELGVTREAVDETKEILSLTQDLPKSLKSPVVSKQEKHKLIDRIFPESMKNFLKVVCDYGEADLLEEIFAAYDVVEAEKNGILQAKLEYVLEPTEDEVAQMKAYLAKKYQKDKVVIFSPASSMAGMMFLPKSLELFSSASSAMRYSRSLDQVKM